MKKIINSILHRIKEDSLSKKTELPERQLEYSDLKSIKSCLVFWVADGEQAAWLKKLAGRLKGVKMDKLCFVPDGTDFLVTDDTVLIKNVELGFGGKIQNDRLPPLLAEKYDLLIDMSMVSNALINYILLNSQARCKIGMKKEGAQADIIIDGGTGPAQFIETMFGLLTDIKKY